MRGRLVFGVGTVAVVLAVGSCSDDVGVTVSERFTATLSGASSRPTPITTTATGTAEFTYVADLATLFYRIDVGPIDSLILAHIHAPADTGTTAGVVLNLYLGSNPAKGLAFTGTLAQGVGGDLGAPVGMTMDSLLVLLRNGHAYVNVHTRAHSAGEIRGQVVKQ